MTKPALLALASTICLAQTPGFVNLAVKFENGLSYRYDVYDVSRFGTAPTTTVGAPAANFWNSVNFSDIRVINGKPARGIAIFRTSRIAMSPTPPATGSIGDVVRNGIVDVTFEILREDNTPIGSVMAQGLAGGVPPTDPNAKVGGPPPGVNRAGSWNLAITGGTGAFVGARGHIISAGFTPTLPANPGRADASITEAPVNRRRNGGSTGAFLLQIIPLFRPSIVTVYHSDLSPVTDASPAGKDEVLIVRATGMGPTRPGVDLGEPFPASPFQEINSPVEATLDGRSTEVVNQIGWPSLVDTYRVDFRVPSDAGPGALGLRLTSAWISSPEVKIPVQ